MISRFSLYGFLKNIRFFEPFILLFFIDRGLTYLEIGFLFSFREVIINIMEVPSGAIADLWGRKSTMVFSMVAYIVSFLIFPTKGPVYLLYIAMFFFALGEAFRTGTHKAILFDYIEHSGRLSEKTKIYGLTRSWSKIGSAFSVVCGTLFVFFSKDYSSVFYFSVVPYTLCLINIALYPSYLNRKSDKKVSLVVMFSHLKESIKSILGNFGLSKVMFQSLIFNGHFETTKNYLQPIIKLQILSLPIFVAIDETRRVALLVGAVYFVIYLLSSFASRKSFRLVEIFESKENATHFVLVAAMVISLVGFISTVYGVYYIPIIGFVLLFMLQNVWRPIVVSTYHDNCKRDEQATILSVDSQAKTVGVFFMAPIIGFFVDVYGFSAMYMLSFAFLMLYIVPLILFRMGHSQES